MENFKFITEEEWEKVSELNSADAYNYVMKLLNEKADRLVAEPGGMGHAYLLTHNDKRGKHTHEAFVFLRPIIVTC